MNRWSRRLLRLTLLVAAWALAVVFALAAAGAVYQAVATRRDARRFPPPGTLIDARDGSRHVLVLGGSAPGPTVVFESPVGASHLVWHLVQPRIAAFAPTVAYDRAGYGWSEAAPGPRTAIDAVNDLQAVLRASGTAKPYVLVGSSLGGLIARLHALQAPDEVAGLVLVDPLHEDAFDRLPSAAEEARSFERSVLLFRLAARIGLLRLRDITIGEGSADFLPDDLRPAARAAGFRTAWADGVGAEVAGLRASFAQVRDAVARRRSPPLGDLPLVVLTRGRPTDPGSGEEEEWEVASALHAALARESSAGRQHVVEGSGHFIQVDAPDAVVSAVREVLAAVRAPS